MWSNLSSVWKKVFLAGWEAFKKGSIPIGAVIADDDLNVLSIGRNTTGEWSSLNPKIAHAETMCLNKLDIACYPDVKKYTLYTSLEPCPMCMGTIVMANIRNIKVAALDSYCGALHLLATDPYMKSKNIKTVVEQGELRDVQLAEHTYYNLKLNNDTGRKIVDAFRKDIPNVVSAAEIMYETQFLDQCVETDMPYNEVYDYIVSLVKKQADN